MIRIDSNQGRIGPLWWVNSDQQPRTALLTVTCGRHNIRSTVTQKSVRWGTFGIGRNIRIVMEAAK